MSNLVTVLLQQRIQSAIDSAAKHLSAKTRDDLLGPTLARFASGGTGKTLLTLACYSDAMRVVFHALLTDGKISKEEMDQAERFLAVVAVTYAKVRPEYTRFASLTREDIEPFLKQYQSDSGSFGFNDESTKWSGVGVCQNIADQCGDSAAVDALRETFVNAAETLLAVDGMNGEEEAFLDQLKAELGWESGDEAETDFGVQHAESSGEISFPLRFPEEHWSRRCAFSPEEDLLAIGGNGIVSIWNTDTRSLLRVIRGKREASVGSLAFLGDGKQIAVCFDDDYQVRIFDVSTGDRECLLDGGGNDMHIWGVSANGMMITSTDSLVEAWNPSTAEKVSSVKVSSDCSSVALDPSGAFATVSRSDDDDLRVYDLTSSDRVGTCPGGHEADIEIIVAGAVSGTVFSIDKEGGLAVWGIPSGEVVRRGKVELWAPESMILTPCGTRLIISGWSNLETESGVILVVGTESFAVLHRIPTENRPELALSGDGNLLAIESVGGLIVIDLRSEDYSLADVVDIAVPDISDEPAEWDEDLDPIAGEEEIEGVFDLEGWALPVEGDIEWPDFVEAVGVAREASLVNDEEWHSAQVANRVLTIEHTGDGMEYIGRVGMSRGLNLCRVVVGRSLPDEIRIVNVDVSEIDCNFSDVQEYTDQFSEQLIVACREGDVAAARRAIASGANLTYEDHTNDLTPLRAALQNGHAEIVQLLIGAGIDVHSEFLAWKNAMVAGYFHVASALKEGGFDVEPLQALLQVCHVGRMASVKELIGMVESLDISESVWDYHQLQATPLTAAALGGHAEIVSLLLDSGASPDQPDSRGIKPWVAAASGDHLDVCELLESKGAATDTQHAFVLAADRGRLDVITGLLDQVDVNAKRILDGHSVSALEAVVSGHYIGLDSEDEDEDKEGQQTPVVEFLLQNGGPPDTIGEDGEPLLHRVVNNHCQSSVRLLAESGADLEAVNADGETAVVVAASSGNSDMVTRLLYRGANPNACSKDGVPSVLLMFGEYMQCDAAMAKWYIGYGVDLDATDDSQLNLEKHCERLVESWDDDEESDEDSVEQAREVLVILQDEDRLQRMHGALRKTPETREELDRLLDLAIEEYGDMSTAYSLVADYTTRNKNDAIAKLRELLQHGDWRWRYAAALTLRDVELPQDDVLPLITGQLGDDDDDVLGVILGTIQQYGAVMVAAAIGALGDCPTSRLQLLTDVLLGTDPERGEEIEKTFFSMLTDDPESQRGRERLRAGIVMGILGGFEQRRENTNKAIELYETSVRLNPNLEIGFWSELAELKSSINDPSLQDVLSIYNQSNYVDEFDGREELLEHVIEMAPDFPWGSNDLAWAFATCSDKIHRDGKKAVELASRACEQDGWHYHGLLDTLAAAHAEAGDFESAVEFARKAIEGAPPTDLDEYQENLQRYENGEAWPLTDEEQDDDSGEDDDDESDWDQDDDDESSEDDGLSSFGNSESIVAFLRKRNSDSVTGDWLKDPEGTLVNSIGMKLVPIEPGEFQMGDPDCDEGEDLCHPVRITKGFYIGMYAVTQGEYFAVTGNNPSYLLGKNRPVDHLSWEDAKMFCELLSQLPEEAAAGRRFRLPSEAEWEYVCRAGTETDFCFGSLSDPSKANFSEHGGQESPQPTLPVGCFRPNPRGLYDTHGNVWEWCSDWFDDEYFEDSPLEDPAGPDDGDHHVLRGGAASNAGDECSSYMRGEASQCDGPSPEVPADGRFEALGDFGIRVVCEIAD